MQFFGIGFLVLLFLEIMSIVWVADWLGAGPALILMILGAISGISMLRHTGLSGLLLAGSAIRSGKEISLYQMLWPIRYAVAAILLISPGFISTAIALVLLLPIKGKPIAHTNVGASFNQTFQQHSQQSAPNDGDIIEGEYVNVDPHSPSQHQDYIEHKRDSSH